MTTHATSAAMTTPDATAPNHRWLPFLRIAFGLLLLVWLFSKIPLHDLRQVLSDSLKQWPWWIAGISATFTGLTTGSIRWWFILRSQHFTIPWKNIFRIFYIGQFFNAFFLGGCGGDLVRAYYVARECQKEKTAAVTTVLIDRGIGLLSPPSPSAAS